MRKTLVISIALLFIFAAEHELKSQSLNQGAVQGTITDPSGAVVPGAAITLKNKDTGANLSTTSNNSGFYAFHLVTPGSYTLTINASGYQATTRDVNVSVGQITASTVKLVVAGGSETVEVTAQAGVISPSPTVSTTMSSEQIAYVPNGGGDLSYIAQTSPGANMNVQGGYGNFATFGIPAISNNFTVNSMPENDPFLNLNNSGATNILLGQNNVDEATVVNNGYEGQYSMPGSNVNYVTKSGANAFHGNAYWRWNGTSMNANGYFNKQNSPPTPRGFVNDNQWAGSIGGPIKKDKTFFFFDTEGLRLIVPVSRNVNLPTPAFEQAVLAHVSGVQPTATSLYQSMFNIYNNAPGAGSAANTLKDGGCADLVLPGFGAANPCAQQLHSTVKGATHEWLITARIDHNFSDRDKIFGHFKMDKGVQATYTDPLDPIFNITSDQPQYEGQLQWTRTITTNMVNSFNLNGSYYRAIFVQPNLSGALALQPVEVAFTGNALFPVGRNYSFPSGFPQGRNVTQYGFVDDLSWTRGVHTLKFGGNLARYDITDYDPGIGSLPTVLGETLTDFYNGVGTLYAQSFPVRPTQPVALYNLGFYGEDKWRIRSNLDLTLTLRADYLSNPVCQTDCFNRLSNNFLAVDHNPNTPYNATILANQHQALPDSYHPWNWQPRFGFSWAPFGAGTTTVISGGFGLFASTVPAGFVDNLMNNLPGDPAFVLNGLPFAPATPGNAQSVSLGAANALRSGFVNGATLASLSAAVPGFSPPSFYNVANDIHAPRFQEWHLQIEKGFGQKTALSLKYVGNHGIWEQVNNSGINAFCDPTRTGLATDTSCGNSLGLPIGQGFAGLPTAPIDPRFLQITEAGSGYTSNYHGLTASLIRRLSSFQFQLNYTWSHALDYVSNGGQASEPFNFNTNLSITSPQNPFNVKQNMYGNADYDITHYFSANYVYTTPKMKGWIGLLADWTIGGTVFSHTGTPFTVVDSGTGSVLNGFGYGGANTNLTTFANQTGGTAISCGSDFAKLNASPCPGMAQNFVANPAGFGSQRRNQVRGPSYFNTDLTVSKNIPIPKWETGKVSVGVSIFNLFNHPNFDQPSGDVADPLFGLISSTVNSPTSIYGSFLNADASPRLIQTEIRFTF